MYPHQESTRAEAILRPFARDILTVLRLDWGVLDQVERIWLFQAGEGVAPTPDPEFPREGWLLRVQRNWTLIDPAPVSTMVNEVADALQTAVMDETGRGWPELYQGGAFVGLLTPRATDDGALVWCCGDSVVFPVGELDLHGLDGDPSSFRYER